VTISTAIPWIPSLPPSWKVQRAKTLVYRSKALNSDRAEKQVLSLTLRGVVDNDPENPEGLVPEDYATYQLFELDDLVFKLIDLENVRTSRVGLVLKRGIMSSAYLRLRPRPGTCVHFLYWSFFDLYNRQIFNHLGSGVRSTLGADDVLNLPLPVPDVATQRAIANYLDRETARIDALITKKQGMIELLEERNGARRGAVIQSVSMGSTRSLRWLLSEAIADGPHETPEFVDNGVPFLSVDSIVDSRIRFDGCRMIGEEDHVRYCRKLMPRYGDVLITKAASVGKVALVDDKRIFNVWSPIAVLRPDQSVLLPEFLWQYLRSPKAQRDLSLGSTSNTQQNISMRDLGSLRIPIVSIEDQRAVCDLLRKDTQGLVKEIEASVVLLHERRQALITAAVTGELEISGVAA
jgi:type I restriction enzyme S subunit